MHTHVCVRAPIVRQLLKTQQESSKLVMIFLFFDETLTCPKFSLLLHQRRLEDAIVVVCHVKVLVLIIANAVEKFIVLNLKLLQGVILEGLGYIYIHINI